MTEFTPEQRAALSFAALVQANAPWRDILVHRLSFTEPGWGPLEQLYGSVASGLAKLYIAPGCAAGLGFAALDAHDAELLLAEWVRLLKPAAGETTAISTPRKELP